MTGYNNISWTTKPLHTYLWLCYFPVAPLLLTDKAFVNVSRARKVIRQLFKQQIIAHTPYCEYLTVFFMILYHPASLHPPSPPRMFPSFISSPSGRTCMCLLCFSAIVTAPLPDAHKMGLSGKTFAPHISHKGSLWPITVLMEARDSHQLHAFFTSHAWTPAKARLALSARRCLAMILLMAREVAHTSSPYYGSWQAKVLKHEGGYHTRHFFPKHSKRWLLFVFLALFRF